MLLPALAKIPAALTNLLFHQVRYEGKVTDHEARFSVADIDDLLARSAANYPDHRAALTDIVPRRTGPTLQVYFW